MTPERPITVCPPVERWRRLLVGREGEAGERNLITHLDGCEVCQRTLDAIASGADGLSEIARRAGEGEPPDADTYTWVSELPATPAAPPPLAAVGRLGCHELLAELGSGGFGKVYRALDTRLQRVVAVKVLRPDLAATSPARQRFLREARAAARVQHPNVVQIHSVEEAPIPYLVMEYVPGESLDDRLLRVGPLPAEEVAHLGRQTADGLTAAHAAGLIHRDIKPANLLVDGDPLRLKITDFGLARAADDASLTRSGVVAGTPLFMSPEQARGDRLDHRTDLFSLGSVLYCLLVGHAPFRAPNTLAVLKRVCEDAPRPIHELIPEAPDWLCRVIAKLMAKDPAERYQSAAEASVALAANAPQPPLVPARSRRRWVVPVAGLFALLAVAAVVAAVALTRPPSDTAGSPTAVATTPVGEKLAVAVGGFQFDPQCKRGRPHFSGDGRLMALPVDGDVRLYDVPSGQLIRTLEGPGTAVVGAGLSPNGGLLAAYSWDPAKLRVWDLTTDKVLYTLDADGSVVPEPVFSPDGRLLVFGTGNPTPRLRVLDATAGREVKSVPTLNWAYGKFNPDGTRFAALFDTPAGAFNPHHPDRDAVTVWDTGDWSEVGHLTHPPAEDAAAPGSAWLQFSPSGKYLAVSGDTGVAVWTADTLTPVNTVKVASYWFDFLADEKTLLVKGTKEFGQVQQFARYEIAGGAERGAFQVKGSRDYLNTALHPSRNYLFVSPYQSRVNRLRVFDPTTGKELLSDEKAGR